MAQGPRLSPVALHSRQVCLQVMTAFDSSKCRFRSDCRGILGANLKELVSGPMTFAFVSNFMIDIGWLLSAMPDLTSVTGRLVIAHGEGAEMNDRIKEVLLRTSVTDFEVAKVRVADAYG